MLAAVRDVPGVAWDGCRRIEVPGDAGGLCVEPLRGSGLLSPKHP